MFGYKPLLPQDVNLVASQNDAIMGDMKAIREMVEKNKGYKWRINKRRFDAEKRFPDFKVGGLVKVLDQSVTSEHRQKLSSRFLSPFKYLTLSHQFYCVSTTANNQYTTSIKFTIITSWKTNTRSIEYLVGA